MNLTNLIILIVALALVAGGVAIKIESTGSLFGEAHAHDEGDDHHDDDGHHAGNTTNSSSSQPDHGLRSANLAAAGAPAPLLAWLEATRHGAWTDGAGS